MYAKRALAVTLQALSVGAGMPMGSVHAGCSYTGLCGTITYLGQTADRTNAVFLVQTTTPGTYSVQATEGRTAGPVDTWRADGPGSHIVISPFPAQYGGTHILNSQVIGPGEFVDSAYQRPDGRVFPVRYGVPESRPATTVVHVAGPNPVVVQSVNQARPSIAVQPQEQTVAVQNVPPPLVMPDPVRVPPQHDVQEAHVVAPPMPSGVTLDKQNPSGTVIAPPAQHTQLVAVQPQNPTLPLVPQPGVVAQVPQPVPHGMPTVTQPPVAHPPVVVTAQPNVPLIDRQTNPGAVVSPPPQRVVIQGVAQPGPTSVNPPQPPVIAPPAQHTQLVAVQPQNPTLPLVPQPGLGAQVPQPVPHGMPTVTQPPVAHPPVVVTAQPNVPLIDRQTNPGAVVSPLPQRVVIQGVAQPGPTSVNPPQPPVIAPPAQHTQLVALQPQTPPLPLVPQPGVGAQVPQPVPHGMPTVTQPPVTHPPVVVTAQPNVPLIDRQTNPGAVAVSRQPQVFVQQVAKPDVTAGGQGSGASLSLPAALSDNCVRPARDVEDRPLSGYTCVSRDKPRNVVWGDARNQKIRDMRTGVNKQGYRQLRSVGFEQLGEGRWSYGLTVGDERESGTVLGDLTRYQTEKRTIGPFAKYALNERWSVIGGVSYTHERTSVSHAPLSGSHRADHLGLTASLSGYLPDGDNWGVPSVHINRNFIRNHKGHIDGVWRGQQVSVVTPASREQSGAITASYDMGRTVYRSAGWAYVLYGQVAAHYDYTHGVATPWSGDLRAGLRVHTVSNLTFDVGVSKLGIMNGVSNRELRITLLQSF